MELSELEQTILYHQNAYYNGNAEISDAEFDLLWDELKSIDPDNSILHTVGKDSSVFPKSKHIMVMGSQNKAADETEFKVWFDKHYSKQYLTELKLDGASLELQYKNGKLTAAITRGDGTTGDNITNNVKKMQGCIQQLDSDFSGAVRGEVILPKKIFNVKYTDKANPRNAAAGTMKHKDGEDCEDLQIIVYDAFALPESKRQFEDEKDKIVFLHAAGFFVVENALFTTLKEICDFRTYFAEHRTSLEYDIDGIVIKSIDIDQNDLNRDRPQKQIAFKFDLEQAKTTLREVIWSASGRHKTPIACFDPVQLCGTTVKQASLANPNLIKELGIKIGSELLVSKRGEIIPKVEKVIHTPKDAVDIKIPNVCKFCKTPLVNEGTSLYCPNDDCPETRMHRIEKWIKQHEIMHLGRSTLDKLHDAGLVNVIEDIYKLKLDDVQNIPGLGEGFQRVLDEINKKRSVKMADFIAGMDFDGIGARVVSPIIDQYQLETLDQFEKLSIYEMTLVNGIAETTAEEIKKNLRLHKDELKSLNKVVSIKQTKVGNKLSGLSFCFTGAMSIKRNDAEKLVTDNGGKISSSVSKNLTYLVTNDTTSGSSKNIKAQKDGVKIIDENEFMKMVK
jgi:DNA ligase (NAD+)